MGDNSLPNKNRFIVLPDELWMNLLQLLPGAARGIETSIRLFSGEVIDRIIISNRGNLIGKEADGLAGYHGAIDNSILTFSTDDSEAVQLPAFHFWQRPRWITLNPQHPARQAWNKRINQ